jgi:hypothetical protein
MTQPSLPLESAAPPAPAGTITPIETWRQPLHELLPALTAELSAVPADTWRYRQLRGEALVALKREVGGRRVLRLARATRPLTEVGLQKWAKEVQVFLDVFGVGHWHAIAMDSPVGIAAGFLELWQGESSPGKAACMDCQTEIPFDKVFAGRDRCQGCAIHAGRAP